MWQHLTYAVHVKYWLLVWIIYRCLYLMLTYFLTHESCKLIIDSMTRTSSYNTTFQWLTYKCHVTYNIKQLVTCTLVFPRQRLVLQVTKLCCIHVWYSKIITQFIHILLRLLIFIYYDGIVKVATLNESGLQQWYDVTHEYECTS